MADLNKFIRSKERIAELLKQLSHNQKGDKYSSSYITDLERSIKILDNKMQEFKNNENMNDR
ncbi:hypothetical protein [Mucilaginibacter sp.]|uniref:hypothetical protein n=1 Tax=Mucilaginibacter sp. TaxID=1882438 RepID=UPI003D0F2254